MTGFPGNVGARGATGFTGSTGPFGATGELISCTHIY